MSDTNPLNLTIYQNSANNPGTPIPIPQQEISRSAINTGIVTGILVALIMFFLFKPLNKKWGYMLPWWVKILLVAIIAWIVDIWIFNTFYPVTSASFSNTKPVFDAAGVIAAVGTFSILDSWNDSNKDQKSSWKDMKNRHKMMKDNDDKYWSPSSSSWSSSSSSSTPPCKRFRSAVVDEDSN